MIVWLELDIGRKLEESVKQFIYYMVEINIANISLRL